MRKKDKEINDRKWIDEIIFASQVCRVAAALENKPYIVPLSFGYDGDSLYFHTAKKGKKIDYFEKNKFVCFEFEGEVELIKDNEKACNWTFDYESVIGYGNIVELTNDRDKSYGLNRIMLQYSGKTWEIDQIDLHRTRIWKIEIDSITGKKSESKSVSDGAN